MTNRRPTPSEVSSSAQITRWYWTRAQLDEIARQEGVSRAGDKQQLTIRLVAHFDGTPMPASATPRRTHDQLRPPFQPDMVVPAGQRMTRDLRIYLTGLIGPGFRFDGHMRDFFAAPAGRTLADAVNVWHETRNLRRPISAQFEYNRFTADYRRAHPDADRQDLLAAWDRHKNTPRT